MKDLANKRALEAFPIFGSEAKDRACGQYSKRQLYLEAYKQAEKDLELTWEDIQLIVNIDWDLDHEGFSCGNSTEEYYKEVLKQFKDERKK